MFDIERWKTTSKFISKNWLPFILGLIMGGGIIIGVYEKFVFPARKIAGKAILKKDNRVQRTQIGIIEKPSAPVIGSVGDHAIIAKEIQQKGLDVNEYVQAMKRALRRKRVPAFPDKIYSILSSPSRAAKLRGKVVSFKAIFLGEWTGGYPGIRFNNKENRIFINHRPVTYLSEETPLGSTDLVTPPFIASIPVDYFPKIEKLEKYSEITVTGRIEIYQNNPNFARVHVYIKEINPI